MNEQIKNVLSLLVSSLVVIFIALAAVNTFYKPGGIEMLLGVGAYSPWYEVDLYGIKVSFPYKPEKILEQGVDSLEAQSYRLTVDDGNALIIFSAQKLNEVPEDPKSTISQFWEEAASQVGDKDENGIVIETTLSDYASIPYPHQDSIVVSKLYKDDTEVYFNSRAAIIKDVFIKFAVSSRHARRTEADRWFSILAEDLVRNISK